MSSVKKDIRKRCGAIITDKKMENMIVIRERSFPISLRRWGIPKGKFKEGEKNRECLHREVFEEVGIDIPQLRHKYIGSGPFQIIVLDYDYSDIPIRIEYQGEIESAMWMRIEDVLHWIKNEPKAFNMATKDHIGKIKRLLKL